MTGKNNINDEPLPDRDQVDSAGQETGEFRRAQGPADLTPATEPAGDPDRELLTAYLDGELDPPEIQKVETRIAVDVPFREQLQELQRTWDMLDELPLTEPTQSFTKSTLELVIKDTKAQIDKSRRSPMTWPIRIAVLVAIPLITFFASSWTIAYVQSAPVRELIRDLPVIENFDVYKKAESIEYLMELDQSGLFEDEKHFDQLLLLKDD